MPKTAQELRDRAAACRTQARHSPPRRAQQLRAAAAGLMRQAVTTELYHHSRAVGRVNVSPSSFREHLRTQHPHPSSD